MNAPPKNVTAAAALGAAVIVIGAVLILSGWRPRPGPLGPGEYRSPRAPAPAAACPPAPLADLAARLPRGCRLLLATDDLAALCAELRAGPAGRIAAAPSVRKFLETLERAGAGDAGPLLRGARLALELAERADGPAAALSWERAGRAGPAAGFCARLSPDAAGEPVLALLAARLAAPGEPVRQEPASPGRLCRTIAPPGRQGLSWGLAGRWVAVCDSLGGCKELLASLAGGGPRGLSPELIAAMAAAGGGRLRGAMDLGGLEPSPWLAALGLDAADPGVVGYAASPDAGGRWSERMLLCGSRPDRGLAAALGAGGRRPVLAALPSSALACLTADVADGRRLWAELRAALGGGHWAVRALEALAGAAGRDMAGDVAPALQGELTLAWLLRRREFYPQTLLGASLAPGAAERLAGGAERALALFGPDGAVKSAERAGARVWWLQGHARVAPLCPAPALCFRGGTLLLCGSEQSLREFLDGRSGRWLEPGEAARLSSGTLGARASLDRLAPFLWGAAGLTGAFDSLPEEARAALPLPDEIAPHLGGAELVARRAGAGLILDLRGPAPAAAAAALLQAFR